MTTGGANKAECFYPLMPASDRFCKTMRDKVKVRVTRDKSSKRITTCWFAPGYLFYRFRTDGIIQRMADFGGFQDRFSKAGHITYFQPATGQVTDILLLFFRTRRVEVI